MLTEEHINHYVEYLFRAQWMKEDHWRDYYNFLLSKGFNLKEVSQNLTTIQSEAVIDDENYVQNYISEYVAGLLK